MTATLWTVLLLQIAMGGFDTLVHHEGTERLAWRPGQATELRLHGIRNLAYAVIFASLGWSEPHGAWAVALAALMTGELLITLWDFVEEDRTRHLPATERINHTLLTLNYGVILALLVPRLSAWAGLPTALVPARYGVLGWLMAVAAVGVVVSGVRDLTAARRCPRLRGPDPAALAAALPARRAVLVTGGTGFVGRRLVEALAAAGHRVTVLTRDAAAAHPLLPSGVRIVTTLDALDRAEWVDAVVNLAGEPIANAPWTRAKRFRMLRSRLEATRDVMRLIARLERKPAVLVSGSAIGVYGLCGDEPRDERDHGSDCFSHRLCTAWERAATAADTRVVLLRTGLVLDSSGGMLARMLTPFEFGVGGRFGDGRQWMSWIHRDDLVRLIVHALATPALRGPVNATAPAPVTNRAFAAALGRALSRPAVLPVPALPLRLALGAFADELLLGGQRVLPVAALASGFRFRYADIDAALAAITGKTVPRLASGRSPGPSAVVAAPAR